MDKQAGNVPRVLSVPPPARVNGHARMASGDTALHRITGNASARQYLEKRPAAQAGIRARH